MGLPDAPLNSAKTRKFYYHPPRIAEARIAAFCGAQHATRQSSRHLAVRIIGQVLCYRASRPTFSLAAAREVLWAKGWTKPRTRRVISWPIDCGALIKTADGLCVCKEAQP